MVLYRRLYFQEETMENDDLKNMGRESDLPKELSEYLMKNHPLKAKEETEKRTERQYRGGEHTARKESEKKTEEIKEEKQNAEEEISAETKHETKTSSIFEAIKNKAMNDEIGEFKRGINDYREYIELWVHEIKTPIALTKLVAENSEGKTKTIIQNQSKKIEEYVDQVLYYSRSTDVSKDYIIKEFDIKETIKRVIRNNRYDLINGRFQIDIEQVSDTVISDEKWVEFIINQIIVNSIKYKKNSDSKSNEMPEIKAYTKKISDKVILTIEDNGIGIIDKDIDKVFNKGFTGHNGRILGKSTGIGLYLCKKLCRKLGLNITLTSKYEQGTKVNIIFPLGDLTSIRQI